MRDANGLVVVLNGFSGGDLPAELRQFREELLFADLEIVTNRINRLQDQQKKPRPAKEREADLVELQHTPVGVVSAGARSVHNLAFTAEVLETFRVPVVGYNTDLFPTFYMRVGSLPVPARADTPAQVAAFLKAHWGLDGQS